MFGIPFFGAYYQKGNYMNTKFEKEKENALKIINIDEFAAFVYMNADEKIGVKKDRFGKAIAETTVAQEIGEAAKLAHLAYVEDGINYYNAKRAFMYIEYSDEDRKNRSEKLYKAAAKKICFINSCCKNLYGSYFIKETVKTSDSESCEKLVNAFEFLIRHYEVESLA